MTISFFHCQVFYLYKFTLLKTDEQIFSYMYYLNYNDDAFEEESHKLRYFKLNKYLVIYIRLS